MSPWKGILSNEPASIKDCGTYLSWGLMDGTRFDLLNRVETRFCEAPAGYDI